MVLFLFNQEDPNGKLVKIGSSKYQTQTKYNRSTFKFYRNYN